MSKKGIIRVAKFSAATAILTLASLGVALAHGPHPIPIPPPRHWRQVPELDPTMIAEALTVFGGVAALLIERYRRRQRRVTF